MWIVALDYDKIRHANSWLRDELPIFIDIEHICKMCSPDPVAAPLVEYAGLTFEVLAV